MSRSKSILNLLFLIIITFSIAPIIAQNVVNELYFTIDLTDIYGSGEGYFDPNTDLVNLMGLDWVGATVVEDKSTRTFEEDPFNQGIFTTVMTISGLEGDSTKWKCKAEPESKFFNSGWEVSPDYWYTIQEDGHVEDIYFIPNIFPKQPALTEAVTILFQVDMTQATNYYTQEIINPMDVEWVGLKGQNSTLGGWAGNWLPSDTAGTSKTLHVLRDDGSNGDKIAGDDIFSAFIEFPAGNEGGPSLFKYGAYYDGALEANGGQSPLDNEMHGTDHWINIKVGGQTEILNLFGTIAAIETSVKNNAGKIPADFKLEQNYPNPFNPTTTISYSISNTSHVELSIFNVQGQKVATLVNSKQSQGSYSASFDGAQLPSGVYVYELKNQSNRIAKKMLMVK